MLICLKIDVILFYNEKQDGFTQSYRHKRN